MLNKFSGKDIVIAIVGLGYVGLPLALIFNREYDVIGFDLDENKIESYKKGIDPTSELNEEILKKSTITFTDNPKELSKADFFIIAVPTPITDNEIPDLSFLISATKIIASNMKENTILIYESTVFPGATEDICIPLIEEITHWTCGEEFSVAYSPERISPGEKNKSIENITKIVSAYDNNTLNIITQLYNNVLEKPVYQADSMKVAEAAKITENIQRDVNIALINELSIIFKKMGIDTYEVLEAADTKWNFTKYVPGLVGGHCIGIDPYYLIYKSKKVDYSPKLIQTSRKVNEKLQDYIVESIISILLNNDVELEKANILILGITFKENCNDIRNSKIVNIFNSLRQSGANITIYDPLAKSEDVFNEYNLELAENYEGCYDAIILAVAHDEFREITYEDILNLSKNKPIIFDFKYLFKNLRKENIIYWSL